MSSFSESLGTWLLLLCIQEDPSIANTKGPDGVHYGEIVIFLSALYNDIHYTEVLLYSVCPPLNSLMFTFCHPLHLAFFFLNEGQLDTPKANYIAKINFGVAVPDARNYHSQGEVEGKHSQS